MNLLLWAAAGIKSIPPLKSLMSSSWKHFQQHLLLNSFQQISPHHFTLFHFKDRSWTDLSSGFCPSSSSLSGRWFCWTDFHQFPVDVSASQRMNPECTETETGAGKLPALMWSLCTIFQLRTRTRAQWAHYGQHVSQSIYTRTFIMCS